MQILVNKYAPDVNINSIFSFVNDDVNDDIEIVDKNEVCCITTKENLLKYDHTNEFELVVYSESDYNNRTYKRVYDSDSVPKTIEEFSCEKANFRFVLCELLVDDKTIKIDLNRFCVVGNILNAKLIGFVLSKYYDIYDADEYVIKILDHNVNSIELNKGVGIKINKDDYEKINFQIPTVD